MKGLSELEAKELQLKYGKNELNIEKKENFLLRIFHVITEPMFMLLVIASIVYFILGEARDGIIMLIFINGIIAIDVIQEWKTDKSLKALKDLSAPKITVIRDYEKKEINSVDLVVGDLMIVHEGVKIPADRKLIKCSGLSVDESLLTGESVAVFKDVVKDEKEYYKNNYCYAGTLVITGTAIVEVVKIGTNTEYGKIGLNVASVENEKTPLQKQTNYLVKVCAIIAGLLFLLVTIITFFNLSDFSLKSRIIESILAGITLAMAMIPEEFPVVLTVFLSMGAWRLAKKNSLVKKLPSVETLGAISVLCVDKTGTITKNQMEVSEVLKYDNDFLEVMGLCCEEETYDPLEKAILNYIEKNNISKNHLFEGKKIKNYSFSNKSKMVGQLWEHDDELILAVKGSFENVLNLCDFKDKEKYLNKASELSSKGLRVLAVAKKIINNQKIYENLNEYSLEFCGLVSLVDPPKDTVKEDIKNCYKAGIKVIMITGDNGITAASIASSVGMKNVNQIITGEEIDKLDDEQLKDSVKNVSIFSRVIPEHKMRIVKALKDNGEIVAMSGDGVNDAPALKYADIGIAMGHRGSEVSREAADLILLDDNFTTIVDTIKDGRRIYDNIRKAVGYIFTIHVPIALSSLIAPLVGISSANLLILPLHVVLLELIIDPTCSIILERLPAESNIMQRKPRDKNKKLVSFKLLIRSLLQGFIIFAACFGTYYFLIQKGIDSSIARSMGLVILIFSNLFLVLVNSSLIDSVITTLKLLAKDKVMWLINFITIFAVLIILYTPINSFLKLASLKINYLLLAILIAFVAVFWYELVKLFKRIFNNR